MSIGSKISAVVSSTGFAWAGAAMDTAVTVSMVRVLIGAYLFFKIFFMGISLFLFFYAYQA
jgi:hypothetical protein